jgi:hypothetical protein
VQTGVGHVSNIRQSSGQFNVAVTSQVGGANNRAAVIQRGNDNFGDVFQDGQGLRGQIKQVGDRNVSLLVQSGLNNTATNRISRGNDNVLTIDQSASGNFALYKVWGDGNTTDIDQDSDNNTVRLDGRRNTTAPVEGVDGNFLDIDQTGLGGHTATGWLEDGASFNTITVFQDGDGNSVSGGLFGPGLYLEGDFNTITITQTGTGNAASAAALGDNSTVSITQF